MSSVQGSRGNRFGCFTYGCGFALVLVIVMGTGLGYYFVKSVRSAFLEYSSESAPTIPVRAFDSQVSDSAQQKLQALIGALDAGNTFSTDVSSDELGVLISQAGWGDKIAVDLSGDVVRASFAFPLTALGDWPAARLLLGSSMSRVFHGTLAGTVSVSDGVAAARLDELTLNGHRLEDMARGHASQWVSGALSARGTDQDPGDGIGEAILPKIRALSVRDGRVYIEVAAKPHADP